MILVSCSRQQRHAIPIDIHSGFFYQTSHTQSLAARGSGFPLKTAPSLVLFRHTWSAALFAVSFSFVGSSQFKRHMSSLAFTLVSGFSLQAVKTWHQQSESKDEAYNCTCPPPCHSISFQTYYSISQFPGRGPELSAAYQRIVQVTQPITRQ